MQVAGIKLLWIFFIFKVIFLWELLNMGRETISIELKFEETSVIDTK